MCVRSTPTSKKNASKCRSALKKWARAAHAVSSDLSPVGVSTLGSTVEGTWSRCIKGCCRESYWLCSSTASGNRLPQEKATATAMAINVATGTVRRRVRIHVCSSAPKTRQDNTIQYNTRQYTTAVSSETVSRRLLTLTSRSSPSRAATQASRHLHAKHWRIHALARPSGVETFPREATAPTVFRTLDKRRSRTPGRPAPPPTGARGTLSTRSRKAQKGTTPWEQHKGRREAFGGEGNRQGSFDRSVAYLLLRRGV